MSEIVAPIHIEALGLANVRFFRSPLDGPRQPWCAIDDLFAAIGIPRKLRRMIKADFPKAPETAGTLRTAAVASGTTDIVPHFIAQAVIGFAQERLSLPKDFEAAYVKAVLAATNVITNGMSDEDSMNHVLAAYRNENGLPPMPPFKFRRMPQG